MKATTGGSGTGMTVAIGYGLSNQLVSVGVVNPGTGYVNGDVITVSEGTGGTFVITKYNQLANQTNNNTVQTNLTFANNTLTLPTYGEIIAPGNITANNIGNITSINLDGNVSNLLTGNGTYVAIPTVPTVGNIATINLDGNVSNLLTGNGTYVAIPVVPTVGNIATINLDGSTSNVLYGNGVFAAVPAPTVTPDITSTGDMSIMTYDGVIKSVNYATVEPSSGNIKGGNISVTGNVSGNYILGNGSQLSGLPATYSDANVATFLAAYGSNTISTTGNITAGNIIGNISITGNVTGTSANVTLVAGAYSTVFDNTGVATFPGNITTSGNFVGNGASLTGVAVRTTGTWTVATGTNTYSITVPINGAYQIWVRCNIPNGIIAYQATVHVTNTNVPVLGTQRAWNYTGGGSPILLTTMPTQIVGAEGTISTTVVVTTTANEFNFVFNNTSGSSQTVSWGYVTL